MTTKKTPHVEAVRNEELIFLQNLVNSAKTVDEIRKKLIEKKYDNDHAIIKDWGHGLFTVTVTSPTGNAISVSTPSTLMNVKK